MTLTLQKILDHVLDLGRKNDPRTQKEIDREMKERKEAYESLDKQKKQYFDTTKLNNPYWDTRILYGDTKRTVTTMLVGIDMEVQELLLAKELNRGRKKNPIDLVMAHHPEGVGLKGLSDVMTLQEGLMVKYGLAENVIEKLLAPHIGLIRRSLSAGNYERAVDAARLLDMPFMCCHTAADNMVHAFLEQLVEDTQATYVGDLIDMLMDIPEYQQGARNEAEPFIAVGSKKSKVGKIALTGITGGTDGPDTLYKKLSEAGVGTIIEMHTTEKNRKKAEKYHINVVIASHIASDSLGMNLILDGIEKKGVEIIPTSGFMRVRR